MSEVLHNTKVAGTTAVTTAGTGMATWLDYIPADIGKLATLVGILLSLVLIRSHWKKEKRDRERHKKEMELLNKKIEQIQ